jgi:hypothetical protein
MTVSARSSVRASEPDLGRLLRTGPFHTALRAAIRERGLTLDRLRAHLARHGVIVGLSSLSDWQHGNRRPAGESSLRAVAALEQVLRIPPESLTRLLIEPAAGGTPATRPRDGLAECSGAVAELLDGLPGSRERMVDVISSQETVRLGAEQQTMSIWSRMVVRARCDGVDRYLLRYWGNRACAIDRVDFDTLENCRLGRVRRHAAGVLVAELLFDDVLKAGDTWVFEQRIVDGTGEPCTEHAHGFRLPDEQYVLEVRFDPAQLPLDCHAFAQPGLYDVPTRTADLTLNRHHAVHLVAARMNAGLVGIAWSWP